MLHFPDQSGREKENRFYKLEHILAHQIRASTETVTIQNSMY
jgi:hypothetical protein